MSLTTAEITDSFQESNYELMTATEINHAIELGQYETVETFLMQHGTIWFDRAEYDVDGCFRTIHVDYDGAKYRIKQFDGFVLFVINFKDI